MRILDDQKNLDHFPEDARHDPVIRRWGHRDCHAFTIALHEMTGWPLITLHDGRVRGSGKFLDECGSIVHSGVQYPDGRFLNVRGLHDADQREKISDYYMHDSWTWAVWNAAEAPTAEELLTILPHSEEELAAALTEAKSTISARLMSLLEAAGPCVSRTVRLDERYDQTSVVREFPVQGGMARDEDGRESDDLVPF